MPDFEITNRGGDGLDSTAKYHAECWAEGESIESIQEEIKRIESMWHSKLPNPFPKNAHNSYSRLVTLREILEKRQSEKKV